MRGNNIALSGAELSADSAICFRSKPRVSTSILKLVQVQARPMPDRSRQCHRDRYGKTCLVRHPAIQAGLWRYCRTLR